MSSFSRKNVSGGEALGGEENGLLKHFYFAMREQHPEKFEFMPYQPGDYSISDEAATSIDAVVFIGKFFLPQSAIEELNRANGSKIDMTRYSLAELVKQTFRSQCQFGKPVTIYFTSD
jgi:hypothetical protein